MSAAAPILEARCLLLRKGSGVPDSRQKYLYERLGDHDFQQLVATLLALQFPDYVPFPLRQADGGRDGKVTSRNLIFQVKWSASGREKDPVTWLDSEIRQEAAKIKRLAREGAKKYVLVTNVEGTAKPKTGSIDRLDAKLDRYSKDLGLEMTCMWRTTLNAIVDSAPTETKWAYADMLAGWDLVRYLVSKQAAAAKDSGLRDLLKKVASAQWDQDERIKFSQVELDRERLTDLFVDVPAERIRVPRTEEVVRSGPATIAGAAVYVASKTVYPFTLVRGAPGQGKSTLSQFVCQAYRAAFMPDPSVAISGLPDVPNPRFPMRLDLGDYAAWLQGYDVFDKSDQARTRNGPSRRGATASVDSYLAELLAHASGRDGVTAAEVQDIIERVPSIIVLDGLDEVGNVADRKRVVDEINLFCSRGRAYSVQPKIVVTTRPNSAGLPEPNPDLFEVISLAPLTPALRDEYLRKWCVVHNVLGNDSRVLRRNFNEKTREPYIGELAGNPMQLTILLYLLRQHGDATPSQRTELYDSYMQLLLAREANKHPETVRKHRADIVEIVPFLGWYLQSRGEEEGHSGRMAFADVIAAMKHFQATYGKSETVVDELLHAASDRLWALTSKEEGTFEFEVLSLREYFAARFLYFSAGEGDPAFDRTVVLRALLRRPYWLNTARFYGGNARGSDLYVLVAGIRQELRENPSKQVRVAAWSFLIDGVFNSRPHEAASVVDALTDEHGAKLLLAALDSKEIAPLPDGGHASLAWSRLTSDIERHPADPGNVWRVRVLQDLLGSRRPFADWWLERLRAALGKDSEVDWLALGAQCEVVGGIKTYVPGLRADSGLRAQLILNCGFASAANSPLQAQLIRAVLDGQCTETTSVRSLPAQMAVVLSPADFYSFGAEAANYQPAHVSADRRALALQHLRKTSPEYADIVALRRYRRGEAGTTYPWANVAAALQAHIGRSWLVSEIAIIGAVSPRRLGVTQLPGAVGLGSSGHPATLIADARSRADDAQWWIDGRGECTDDLACAEWALAFWAMASNPVFEALSPLYRETLHGLDPEHSRSLAIAADRLVESGWVPDRSPMTHRIDMKGAEVGSPRRPRQGSIDRESQPPLADAARRAKWLKVDQHASYR